MRYKYNYKVIRKKLKNLIYTLLYFYKRRSKYKEIQNITTITFLCYGNICRSPYCEYYLKKIIAQSNINNIASAGVYEKEMRPAAQNAILAAKIRGVDMSKHQSKKLTSDLVNSSDIIIGMHYFNFLQFKKRFPESLGKFFLLKEFDKKIKIMLNIPDPYGKPIDTFMDTYEEIEGCIDNIAKRL